MCVCILFLYSWASLVAQKVKSEKCACNEGDPDSMTGSGKSPREGNGNPLQYSCLENPMDGGAWQATVQGVSKSQTRLTNNHTCTYVYILSRSLMSSSSDPMDYM